MRILVVGAAGFLGESAVRACARAGHEVRGLVRSSEQLARVSAAGGQPILGDICVPESLTGPIAGCDVAIHLATRSRGSLAEMQQSRILGCQSLLSAAERARVRRVVIGSGYWLYRDSPGMLTEESPIQPTGMPGINFATEEVARQAAQARTVETVIIRPGMVYGNGSWFREMVDELRAGTYQYVADGSSYWSPISLEDTGEAFRAVCEQWTPGETYLAVDDTPVTIRELATFVADQIGSPPPRSLRREDARREWGAEVTELVVASRRASNAKLKKLGWAPRFTRYTDGMPEILRAMVVAPH
ncbi:MAG: NAD(P)H-binding protein [Thermoplasmata archaeon]